MILKYGIKSVANALTDSLTLSDADLAGATLTPAAGDRWAVIAQCKITSAELSTPGAIWQSYKCGDPPTLGLSGGVFSQSTDQAPAKTNTATVFALSRAWTAAETLSFTARRPDVTPNTSGVVFLLWALLRDVASNPFGSMPEPTATSTGGATFDIAELAGQAIGADVIRWLGERPSANSPATIGFSSGPSWSAAAASGGAFGGQRTSQLVVAAYPTTVDAEARVPGETATVSPNFAGLLAQTVVLASKNPLNRTKPVIGGVAQGGQTLSWTDGSWSGETPMTAARQLQREGAANVWSDIAGATGSSYVVSEASDVGHRLRVKVTMTNGSSPAGEAFSDPTTTIVTGSNPTPTGTPAIKPTAYAGFGMVNEALEADVSGVGWPGGTPTVIEWGRSTQPTLPAPAIVGTSNFRGVVSADLDLGPWLTVRQRNTQPGGVSTPWATPVKAIRLFIDGQDLIYRLPVENGAGVLIPGGDLLGFSGWPSLLTAQAAAANYVDYSLVFMVNLWDAPIEVKVWLKADTPNPQSEVDFAASSVAASTPVPAFAATTQPAISGSFVHPTVTTKLSLGMIPAAGGYKALVRRRTLTAGAGRYLPDNLSWDASRWTAEA